MSEGQQVVVSNEIDALINAFNLIGRGELAKQSAENLQECVRATMSEDKTSTLTITLKIKKNGDEMLNIEGTTKVAIPQPVSSSAFFYNQQTCLPSRNRPEQTILFKEGE